MAHLPMGTPILNRSQEYYDSEAWRGTWKLDGGVCLMNLHAIELLQWLMGLVEDTAAAILRFRNGAVGTIEGATCAAYKSARTGKADRL